jgi:hypothetical protein
MKKAILEGASQQTRADVERIKAEAQTLAEQVCYEDVNLTRNTVAFDVFMAAREKAVKQVQKGAEYIDAPAWMFALDIALELAIKRTDDPGIESFYRGLALIREWLDNRTAAADGFMASERDPPGEPVVVRPRSVTPSA